MRKQQHIKTLQLGGPSLVALIEEYLFKGWSVHSFYVDPTGRNSFVIFEQEIQASELKLKEGKHDRRK